MASQLATIVVTDLVGSTALRVRLGEERAEALRHAHDAFVRDAVESHEGRVVKGLGDGVLAAFPGAAEAVAAAVAIQQAIDSHTRRHPDEPLAVRVGVSAGDVTHEEGDVFGTPVIEAARLCAAAEGGEILVADIVRGLARGRGGHEFGDVRALELKGLDGTVAACSVAWEPIDVGGVPLPPALATATAIPAVGRTAELKALHEAWHRAVAVGPQLVLLAGEPGVGKTRLASELAQARHAEDATVLLGRCDEEASIAFGPVVDALRHLVDAVGDDVLRDQAGADLATLVRLVPRLAARFPDVLPTPPLADAELDRQRLFDAVGDWFGALAPLLVVLDDVHWADTATLLLLRHLSRRRDLAGVAIVATYRDVELSRTHPLSTVLADLRTEDTVERIGLAGLDRDGITELVEAMAGHDLDAEGLTLVDALEATTDGNPFFVTEILRHLGESGSLVRRGGRWTAAGKAVTIPEGVREVVGRRLSRLGEETNRVLRTAAVIGREFDVRILASATDLTEDALLDHLEEALRARLVDEVQGVVDRFAFTHAIVRETLYHEVTTSRRVRLHRRIGTALEERWAGRLDDHLAELAYHFGEAAASGDVDSAVDYARRAGDAAIEAGGYEDAAAAFERALAATELREPVDERERGWLLRSLADVVRHTGDSNRSLDLALEALDLARRTGDAELLGEVALTAFVGSIYVHGYSAGDAAAILWEALEAVGPAPTPLRVRLIGAMNNLAVGPSREEKVRLADEAVEIARQLDDPWVLADALHSRLFALAGPEHRAERIAVQDELRALTAGIPREPSVRWSDLVANSMSHEAISSLSRADRGRFDAAVAKSGVLAVELGNPVLRYAHRVWITTGLLLDGRWAEAEVAASEAFDAQAGQATELAAANLFIALVRIRYEVGGAADLEPVLAHHTEANPDIVAFRCALARMHAHIGRIDEAATALAELAVPGATAMARDGNWPITMAQLAEACIAVGDREVAALLFDEMAPFPDVAISIGMGVECAGSIGLQAGRLATLLGRYDDALEHLAVARRVCESLRSPPWITRCDAAVAETLIAAGRPGADAALADARRAAEALGMTMLLAELDGQA